MQATVIIARAMLSITGILLILLGILFWTGRALNLIPLHMLLGAILVLSLWALVAAGFHARITPSLVALVLVWSLIVPLLGVTQMRLLPGSWHWVIQVLHLLVGVVAIGIGHVLGRRTFASLPRSAVV